MLLEIVIYVAPPDFRCPKSWGTLKKTIQHWSIGPTWSRKVRHGATEISGSRSARGRPEEVMPVEQLTPDSDIYSWTEAAWKPIFIYLYDSLWTSRHKKDLDHAVPAGLTRKHAVGSCDWPLTSKCFWKASIMSALQRTQLDDRSKLQDFRSNLVQ